MRRPVSHQSIPRLGRGSFPVGVLAMALVLSFFLWTSGVPRVRSQPFPPDGQVGTDVQAGEEATAPFQQPTVPEIEQTGSPVAAEPVRPDWVRLLDLEARVRQLTEQIDLLGDALDTFQDQYFNQAYGQPPDQPEDTDTP